MLWTIIIILMILWLIAFVGLHVIVWWIHLLLVIAVIVLIIRLLTGRKVV